MCSDSNFLFFIDTGVSRAELNTVKNNVPDTYILSTSDLNVDYTQDDSVHAYAKPKQAQRLGKMVSTIICGDGKDPAFSAGPTLVDIEYDGDSVILTYDNVGTGLKFDGGEYKGGFFLLYDGDYNGGTNALGVPHAYQPRNFVEIKDKNAVEIIAPDKIKITGTEEVLGAAYNILGEYSFPRHVNLCNGYGVPAVSFVEFR